MEQDIFLNKTLVFLKFFIGSNLMWFIFNLPLVVLGSILMKVSDVLVPVTIISLILVPFILFPATTGMFGVIRKFMRNEDVSVIQGFLKHYKDNYKRSIVGGMIFTLLWIILGYVYFSFSDSGTFFMIILAIIGLALFMVTLNFICITVHMEAGLSQSIQNAGIITITGNILSLIVGLISIAALYFSYTKAIYLIPFITGAFITFIVYWTFQKMMQSIQALYDKQKKQKQDAIDEEEKEELEKIEAEKEEELKEIEKDDTMVISSSKLKENKSVKEIEDKKT